MFNSLYLKTLSGFSFVWLPRILMFKKKENQKKGREMDRFICCCGVVAISECCHSLFVIFSFLI